MIVIRKQPTLLDWTWPLMLHSQCLLKVIPDIETTNDKSGKDEKSETKKQDSEANHTPTKRNLNSKPEHIPTKRIRTVEASDMKGHVLLAMDLPGVKAENVKVTESNFKLKIDALKMHKDKTVAKFHHELTLDPETNDSGKLEAYLSDGVLSLKIPKKATPETVPITPTLQDVPEEKEGLSYMRLEVPGVKAKDLKISVTGWDLSIEAKREIGKSASVIKKSLKVDGEKIDVSKTEAFLCDGILTLSAPWKEANSNVSYTFEVKQGLPLDSIKEEATEEPALANPEKEFVETVPANPEKEFVVV